MFHNLFNEQPAITIEIVFSWTNEHKEFVITQDSEYDDFVSMNAVSTDGKGYEFSLEIDKDLLQDEYDTYGSWDDTIADELTRVADDEMDYLISRGEFYD